VLNSEKEALPGLLVGVCQDQADMEQNLLKDDYFMEAALEEAGKAFEEGEIPIGAVAVKGNAIIARDHNRTIQLNDPTAHAEILLLRKTSLLTDNYRLPGISLFVTIEPCPMCAGAMVQSRIDRLVFGASDKKGGGVVSRFNVLEPGRLNHDISVLAGVLEDPCREIMRRFFSSRR
jgi:tRNA(adenine34) deaminase